MRKLKAFTGLLSAFLCLGWSNYVSACQDFVQVETEQLSILHAQIQNDESPLQQLTAFRLLSCSNDPGIRDFALRTGLLSSNPSIRTSALHLNVLSKNSLVIDMLEETENLTEEEIDYINNNPVINFQVSFTDLDNNCLGLYYNNCGPNYNLRLSGQTVVIAYTPLSASFRLNSEGRLVGLVKADSDAPFVPAELILF